MTAVVEHVPITTRSVPLHLSDVPIEVAGHTFGARWSMPAERECAARFGTDSDSILAALRADQVEVGLFLMMWALQHEVVDGAPMTLSWLKAHAVPVRFEQLLPCAAARRLWCQAFEDAMPHAQATLLDLELRSFDRRGVAVPTA